MKKRAILGVIVAVFFSVLFAGTALAETVSVTYPEGDPKAAEITAWGVLPDGRVHCSCAVTASGYSAGIIEAGENGQPMLTTFDSEEDFAAAQEARGWEPLEAVMGNPVEGRLRASSGGDGHIGINVGIKNPSNVYVNWSNFITNYSFNTTQITYYVKHPYSFSSAGNGWAVLSGPNYTAPAYIPTSTSALGTYNTSFTGPVGEYNWLSLRNRAYPNGGVGYGISSIDSILESAGYSIVYSTNTGPGWY